MVHCCFAYVFVCFMVGEGHGDKICVFAVDACVVLRLFSNCFTCILHHVDMCPFEVTAVVHMLCCVLHSDGAMGTNPKFRAVSVWFVLRLFYIGFACVLRNAGIIRFRFIAVSHVFDMLIGRATS